MCTTPWPEVIYSSLEVISMSRERKPNTCLATLLAEAGLTNKALGRQVRELAQRAGHSVAADHTSVSRWLSGMVPREPARSYIAQVIGAHLGRRVGGEDLGFCVEADDLAFVEEGSLYSSQAGAAVRVLAGLASADLEERPAIRLASWKNDAAPAAITGYLFDGSDLPADLGVANGDAAAAIRATAAHLMDLDFRLGGGHSRRLLLFYFGSEVAPLLTRDYAEPIRREIFGASAEVAQLLGWSAYDAGYHGAAQRYFVQGLRLAREAQDHMLGGRLLANLSHQANFLGRYDQALQLARAAQSATAGGKATPAVESMYLAMEARALASSGNLAGCLRALNQAERLFGRSRAEADPAWIGYFDSEELAGEAAHCFRDLQRSPETREFAAQAIAGSSTPPRTRAFINMVTASAALQAGSLDEATALAVVAVETAGPIKSGRYLRYLSDFCGSLETVYPRHPCTLEFIDRVRAIHPHLAASG